MIDQNNIIFSIVLFLGGTMTLERIISNISNNPQETANIISMWLSEDNEPVLTGREKAAAFMVSVGPEVAVDIFHHLRKEEIEKISAEITKLKGVDLKQQNNILGEFLINLEKRLPRDKSGSDYARKILGAGNDTVGGK